MLKGSPGTLCGEETWPTKYFIHEVTVPEMFVRGKLISEANTPEHSNDATHPTP